MAEHSFQVSIPNSHLFFSGESREGAPLILAKKNNKNNEKTQKEEKPAGQAIFANQFCFNISKKRLPQLKVWIRHCF